MLVSVYVLPVVVSFITALPIDPVFDAGFIMNLNVVGSGALAMLLTVQSRLISALATVATNIVAVAIALTMVDMIGILSSC